MDGQQTKRGRGRPPKPYARRLFRLTVPELLAMRFEQDAEAAGMTVGQYLTAVLEERYPEEGAMLQAS